nr:hypothetical protein [Tanacetum cinerariifolium]
FNTTIRETTTLTHTTLYSITTSTDHRVDIHEVSLTPRNKLCYTFGPRFKVGKSSYAPTVRPAGDSRPDYEFIATLDDEIMQDPERDVGYGITDS